MATAVVKKMLQVDEWWHDLEEARSGRRKPPREVLSPSEKEEVNAKAIYHNLMIKVD